MSWIEFPQSDYKSIKICDAASHYRGFCYDLQINTSVLLPYRHSQRFHKLVFLSSEPTDMRNAIYVEVEITLLVLFK